MFVERDQIKTLLIIAAVSAVFAVGLWLPVRSKQNRIRADIDRLKCDINNERQDKENATRWQGEIRLMQAYLRDCTRYVPEKEQLAEVLHGLSNALKKNEAVEQNVLTAETTRYIDYTVIPVTMEYYGSFPATYGILQNVESMSRLIRVEKLAVLQPYQRDDGQLKINMQVSSFYSKLED